MKKITLLLFFICAATMAQVTNEGQPLSWRRFTSSKVSPIVMPQFDLEKVKAEDKINDQARTKPYRFGYKFDVNYNTYNAGAWEELQNGDRIWRINFISKGALTMNFIFDYYYLPEGATLYLYSNDRKDLLGAYTALENQENGILGTWIVKGENVWLEYHEPQKVRGLGRLNIDKVIHGYRGFYQPQTKGLNASGDCNVDVKCDPNVGGGSTNWTNTRDKNMKGVAVILVNGNDHCTGTLVNNTKQDKKPYFLTAHHCLMGAADGAGSGFNASSWTFGFDWIANTPDCATTANTNGPNASAKVISGATLRANRGGSDFALFELSQSIPTAWNTYFAGWDRSDTAPTEQLGIHHPSGDIMKISRNDQPATKAPRTIQGQTAQCWIISDWDYGVTEGGSSGSALFDTNGRIIGQLFGGAAACSGTSDNNQEDFYGRFATSWDTGSTAATRLKDWLDPDNTNQTTLDGAFDQALSITEEELQHQISIYPNPTNGNIAVKHALNNLTYELYNTVGQKLASGSLNNNNTQINLTTYNTGVYFLKITNDTGTMTLTKKIVLKK